MKKVQRVDPAAADCPDGACDVRPGPGKDAKWADLLSALCAQQEALYAARTALHKQMVQRMSVAEAFGEVGQVLTVLGDVESGQPMLKGPLQHREALTQSRAAADGAVPARGHTRPRLPCLLE